MLVLCRERSGTELRPFAPDDQSRTIPAGIVGHGRERTQRQSRFHGDGDLQPLGPRKTLCTCALPADLQPQHHGVEVGLHEGVIVIMMNLSGRPCLDRVWASRSASTYLDPTRRQQGGPWRLLERLGAQIRVSFRPPSTPPLVSTTMGHLRDIRSATEELQAIESEILKVFKEGRPEEPYPLHCG